MTRFIAAMFVVLCVATTANARPAGCPYQWCGCWLAMDFGYTGTLARKLWLARNWAVEFPRTSLAPGMVAVFARGKRGGHVGKILAVHNGGRSITMISGNDGRAVRTRERSTRGLIAVVNPHGGEQTAATRAIKTARTVKTRQVLRRSVPQAAPSLFEIRYAAVS